MKCDGWETGTVSQDLSTSATWSPLENLHKNKGDQGEQAFVPFHSFWHATWWRSLTHHDQALKCGIKNDALKLELDCDEIADPSSDIPIKLFEMMTWWKIKTAQDAATSASWALSHSRNAVSDENPCSVHCDPSTLGSMEHRICSCSNSCAFSSVTMLVKCEF